jgi:outer membrane protein OmpA-like peptidoglycan-associated protein
MRRRVLPNAALALVLASFAAWAAQYPVDSFDFAMESLDFLTDAINLPSDPIAFPSEMIEEDKGRTIEVTLPADILFDFDKADVRPDATAALHELAARLSSKARGPVIVKGYTDALGKDAYNQKLSEKRAEAIKAWLVAKENLGRLSFTTIGFGARDPVAPNTRPDGSDDPGGRQLNRRVTIVMTK